jgi:cupin fold WbuC family metalloprotein
MKTQLSPGHESSGDVELTGKPVFIDDTILDYLTRRAKESPRLRMNLDLRDTTEDKSQRMLNAVEPGTVLPIHRHSATSETVVCLRGRFSEIFYDDEGVMQRTYILVPGKVLNIPIGQWHKLESYESGTVLLECKEGPYEPLSDEDILKQ